MASAQVSEQQRPARRTLWSVLGFGIIPLGIAGIVVAGAAIYFGYYMFFGYRSDPLLQTVMIAIQHSAAARPILGDNIAITGLPFYDSCTDASGQTARYDFSVRGSKGAAAVSAAVFVPDGRPEIKTIVLTSPDGHRYDLAGDAAAEGWLVRTRRQNSDCSYLPET